MKSKKTSERLGQALLWVLLIGALLIFSIPFLFMITNSFEEFSYVLPYPPKLIPQGWIFRPISIFFKWTFFPLPSATV